MPCVNECSKECCNLPAYRNDVPCDRCGRVVLTVWYCLTCGHMSEEEGPDYTDSQRLQICFNWPNPPFKIPFRIMNLCRLCKVGITDISVYGVNFDLGYHQKNPDDKWAYVGDKSQLQNYPRMVRFRVVQEPRRTDSGKLTHLPKAEEKHE